MFNFNQSVMPGYKQINQYGENNEREVYKRSVVDRAIGAITNTSITNALYNATDGDKSTGFIEGIGEGFNAMNPMLDDVRDGQHYTSDVLGNLGWNPKGAVGKTAKFVTSLAGDIVLDPMTYVNPIGAASKVISGTGRVTKAIGKKSVTMTELTFDEAVGIISDTYKTMKRPVNQKLIDGEAEALMNSFNSNIKKVKSGGQDFQIGTQNLPFVKKTKPGEKAFGAFNKVLMDEDSLRKLGDKTIAPYYNELVNKLKNYKAIKVFTKDADIKALAQTDNVKAATLYKMDRLVKGFSSSKFGETITGFKDTNKIADMLDDFTDNEKDVLRKWYDEGGARDMFNSKGVVAKFRDKANGNNKLTKALEQFNLELDDYMKSGGFNAADMKKARRNKAIDMVDTTSVQDVITHFKQYSDIDVGDYVKSYVDLKSTGMPQFKKIVDVDGVEKEILETADAEKFLKVSEAFSKSYAKIADAEVAKGRLNVDQAASKKGSYMARIQTDEAKRWALENITRDFNGKFNPESFAAGYKKVFNKSRKFDTIEESNAYMFKKTGVDKWFEEDMIKMLQARQIASNDLIYNDEMVRAVRNITGVPWKPKFDQTTNTLVDNLPNNYTPVMSYIDLNETLMKAFGGEPPAAALEYIGLNPKFYSPNNAYIPVDTKVLRALDGMLKDVGYVGKQPEAFGLDISMMNRVNRESSIQKKMHEGDFLNIFDKYQTIWKMWNTVINPGFHAQNSLSNAFNSFMQDGVAAVDPKKLGTAANIFSNKTPDARMMFGGVELTHSQIRTIAEKYGILNNTFFQSDIAKSFGDKGILHGLGIKGEYDPTDMNKFIPYDIGGKVGSKIEGTQRLSLFINRVNAGEKVEDAVASVNKYLFDYSDLTEFEKNTMKRVLPFYTFMRKNVPLTLEQMIENPKYYQRADKTLNNIELMSGDEYVPDDQRTEWRRDHTQLPFTIGDKKFGINTQLPYQQLDRLSPNRLIGQSTPLAKIPYEGLTGEYAYTGIDIDSFGDYIASQTTPTKVLSMYGKKEGVDRELYAIGQTTGFPMGTLEPVDEPAYSMADMMR